VKISAVIIAFNEGAKIADAVRSVAWADEVLVVDSESTDETREIAAALGAKVIVEKWLGFAGQKQFACDSAANDMILSLDADERVTPELRDEVLALSEASERAAAYSIPRLSTYMKREIRHCGWYPDRQIRLFDRSRTHWKDVAIHESVVVDAGARVEQLTGDILHFSVDSVAHHSRMIQERYAPLGAAAMRTAGRTTSPLQIALEPIAAFISTYVLKLGLLDGLPGLAISYFAAYNVFLKHLLLYESQNARKAHD
jgi:glycosyltransferase involved in cell wall biosynthesis